MNSDDQDIRIVRQIRRGDKDAYAAIVEKYKNRIYALAVRLTGSPSDAEDLAQEVFLHIFEKQHAFDETRRFYPWMYTLALNVIRNHLKKNRAIFSRIDRRYDAEHQSKVAVTAEDSFSIAQQQNKLARCILRLPAMQKEAVILRYYQELSFEDISEIQACSISAAKMRVYRGLEKLNRLMQRH